MGQDELNVIQRALGVVEGTLRGLMDQWGRQEAEAARMRQENNQKLELLSRQVERLSSDLHNVQQDVAEMRNDYEDRINPALNTAEAERNQRIGSRTVWALFATGAATVLTSIGYVVDRLIKYWSLPPH